MTTAVIFVAGPVPDLDRPGRRVAPGPSAADDLGGTADEDARRESARPPAVSTLGDRLRSRIARREPAFAVAADGGLDLALRLGRTPEFVIGDMDSVTEDAIETARGSGSSVRVLPRAKDVSDFELALDSAVEHGAGHLVVVGGAGGRLDHVLATVLTLTAHKYSQIVLEALLVDNYVAVINGDADGLPWAGDVDAGAQPVMRGPSTAVTTGVPGDPVSLFAFNGAARGVRTRGLAWQLEGATLDGGTSLGVSNELLGAEAAVAVEHGCLAVVRTARYVDIDAAVDGGHIHVDAEVGVDGGARTGSGPSHGAKVGAP